MPALEYSEWIDTITLILTVAGLILGFIYSQVLQNVDDRADLIASLRAGHVRRLYQGGVNWFMRGLQKLYGNAESLQAFSVSYLLSFFYPVLFFIFSYSYLDGAYLFAGKELLPIDASDRSYFIISLVMFFIVMFLLIKFLKINHDHKVDTWGVVQMQQVVVSPTLADQMWRVTIGLLACIVVWFASNNLWLAIFIFLLGYSDGVDILVGSIMGVIVFAGIFTFTAVPAPATFAGGFVTTGFLLIVVIASITKNYVRTGILIVAGSLLMSTTMILEGQDYKSSLILAYFCLALPLVNALLDWLSWWVSRWFLERTAQAPRVRIIVLDVVLDFGVAVLFMLALCLLLPAGAILLDSLYEGWVDVKTGVPPQTGWQEYAVWARDDPWGKGIMVTLMLVTTLIPTLLHILLGLMAFFIHGFKGAALADFLEQPRKNWRDAVASLWMFGYVLIAGLAMLALYQGLQHFIQLPIAHWLYRFTGYFYELP